MATTGPDVIQLSELHLSAPRRPECGCRLLVSHQLRSDGAENTSSGLLSWRSSQPLSFGAAVVQTSRFSLKAEFQLNCDGAKVQ